MVRLALDLSFCRSQENEDGRGPLPENDLSHGGSKILFLNGGEGFFKIDATERAIFATIGV